MNILVCSMVVNDWYKDAVKYAIRNLKNYCETNNYNFQLYDDAKDTNENKLYDKTRAVCWYKIKYLLDLIDKYPNYDYFVWFDADIQILRHDIKLEQFIMKYMNNNNINCVLAQETVGGDGTGFNTGLMFFRNCEKTIELLNRIWNYPTNDYFENFHEQSAFIYLYCSEPEIKNSVFIVSGDNKIELVCYWGHYYPGLNFCIHCAGCSHDKLGFYFMMDCYYPFMLDEENEEDYKARTDWLFHNCRKDIDKWLRNEKAPRLYSVRCKDKFGVN